MALLAEGTMNQNQTFSFQSLMTMGTALALFLGILGGTGSQSCLRTGATSNSNFHRSSSHSESEPKTAHCVLKKSALLISEKGSAGSGSDLLKNPLKDQAYTFLNLAWNSNSKNARYSDQIHSRSNGPPLYKVFGHFLI